MSDRCTETREKLEEMLHSGLSGDEIARIEKHLAECAGCREYRNALLEDDRLLTGMTRSMNGKIERLEERVMESIEKQYKDETTDNVIDMEKTGRKRGFSGGLAAKLALAAAAALVLIVGWNLIFRGGPGDVAWAQVIAQVREAQDYICRIDRVATPMDSMEMIAWFSEKYGQKKAQYIDGKLAVEIFVRQDEQAIHVLHHKNESYFTIGLTSRDARKMTDMTSARDMVEYFHSFEYREIGTRDIAGIKASGIEVIDPVMWAGQYEEGSVRLWVDASTNWPVLIEREFKSDEGKVVVHETYRDFQWNPSLSKEDFEFEVPEDYITLDFGDAHEGEEGAIEGLRAYSKLTNGRYPADPALGMAASEIRKNQDRLQKEGLWGSELFKEIFKTRNFSAFHAGLVEDGVEVEYHGDSVGALDHDKVLMRWKIEDGRWRVIYGDLRAETVEGD